MFKKKGGILQLFQLKAFMNAFPQSWLKKKVQNRNMYCMLEILTSKLD